MTSKPECHLFIILARDAHRAVIFRRGPRFWTQLILWDTDTDTFTEGQWFKGKVYTKRCDVSPDGSKMVYFSAKHYKRFNKDADVKNNWTAISRPPYWTVLAMWDSSETWGGGGFFEDDGTLYLTWSSEGLVAKDQSLPPGFTIRSLFEKYQVGLEDGIYFDVLLPHRGWTMIQGEGPRFQYPSLWRKSSPYRAFDLLMTLYSGYGENTKWGFTVLNKQNNQELLVESEEWADWDHRGRLIYTDLGKLFVGEIGSDRIEPIQMADFSANKPTPIHSPAWARTWDQKG